jgi:hypothetical protein
MRLEQAIFTSVRSERLDGYQLAARSAGVSDELAKELTSWGPAHDSLWRNQPGATSVNFHSLSDGRYCTSLTTLSGAEYSGRGGGRVYTQMIVIAAEDLERFAGDPFLVLRALTASGRLMVYDQVPGELPSLPLIGRAGTFYAEWAEPLIETVGAETIAELAEAGTSDTPITVITNQQPERLFQVVLHQLTLAERMLVSLTTGLKPSSRRPFKFTVVPDDPQLVRQSTRMNQGRVIEAVAQDSDSSSRQRLTALRAR